MAKAIQVATDESVEIAFVDQGYTGERPAAAAMAHGIEMEVVKPCGEPPVIRAAAMMPSTPASAAFSAWRRLIAS